MNAVTAFDGEAMNNYISYEVENKFKNAIDIVKEGSTDTGIHIAAAILVLADIIKEVNDEQRA